MVYLWRVRINGREEEVNAINSWTAIARCLEKTDIEGTIIFKRLNHIKRIKCTICGESYEDNPECKKYHEEVYIHKRAIQKSYMGD